MNWQELKDATSDELAGWAEAQPWAQAMSDCAQDADWHAEGDVWTHSKMVLMQVEQLDEWNGLSPREQAILRFTALLHDSAKPLTTRVIYSPNYTSEANLSRLRSRGLGAKRSLALREFALGVEALERFVRREPLRRVHECVFGVLALESEPVDPRL